MVKQSYYQNQDAKRKQASGILSNLGLKTPLNKIGWYLVLNAVPLNAIMTMNETVNKCLLAWDKCMPEMYLKQSGFTYSACEPFTKINKEFENLMKQEMNWVRWIR